MFFILQTENGLIKDTEVFELRSVLKRLKHQYCKMDISDLDADYWSSSVSIKDVIPVGNLDFVGKYLKSIHRIGNLNPIEVPSVLRKDIFLGRGYKVVKGMDVPKTGRYFIKNASVLKDFSFSGDISCVVDRIRPEYNYVLSSLINILAEYRVIVVQDKIEAVQYYDGNPLVFPDARTIQKSVLMYMMDNHRPKAYSMDFAVTKNETVILEVHPTVSLGTYGYVSDMLPYMYKLGLDYYKEINLPVSLS